MSITEADSATFEYGYDETDQLVKEVRYDDLGDTVYGREYSYDPLGNRLVKEDLVSGDTVGYSYGADNRMLSAGDISFSYDIGGNMVEKDDNGDTVAYEWDEGNNLSKVTLSDGTSMELTYDGDDIRASRTIDGEEVQFAWDPQSFNVVGEYDDLGQEDVAYGPQIGMDDPWVMMRESNAYFFQTDHLNSVTELTDENEAVQNEYRYKAFGEALQAVEMVENEYQFTARRQDGVDGIQFNRYRHYQAEFGRWNQWDIIRYDDGVNLYRYANNNPNYYLDRDGTSIVGAVAVGVTVGTFLVGGTLAYIKARHAAKIAKGKRLRSRIRHSGSGAIPPSSMIDELKDVRRTAPKAGKKAASAGGGVPGTSFSGPPPGGGPSPSCP